jgi:hypothetical protein
MADIQQDTLDIHFAEVIAIFLESMLYGVYISTLWYCFRGLLTFPAGLDSRSFKMKPVELIPWTMIAATSAIALLATVNVGIEVLHCIQTVVYRRLERPWVLAMQVRKPPVVSKNSGSQSKALDPVMAAFIVDAVLVSSKYLIILKCPFILTLSC